MEVGWEARGWTCRGEPAGNDRPGGVAAVRGPHIWRDIEFDLPESPRAGDRISIVEFDEQAGAMRIKRSGGGCAAIGVA